MLTAPEHPFNQMARQANKLLDHLQKGFYVYSGETWTPNVNLYETSTSYLVCVDLAGVDKQKIDVEVVDQRLKLRGTRAVPSFDDVIPASASQPGAAGQTAAQHGGMPTAGDGETGAKRVRIHLMEIDHGAFSREVELPLDVNRDNITANYRNGMLWVEIPKCP
jgi:HSP20 family molecular chaperone IbpA